MGDAVAATGNLESAGVVLAAVDQFSANIQKYVDDLRKIQAQSQTLTDVEKKAADAATKTSTSWKISGEQASKYGLAAGVLSGQMRNLGIQNEVAARGIGIATEAMSGSLGVIGGVIIAVGTLATAIAAVVTHEQNLRKEVASATDRLVGQASQTGILNDAERDLLAIRKTQITLEIKHAEAILQKSQAMGIELNLWERLAIGALQASHQFEVAARLAAEWTVSQNQAATAEQLEKLRQLQETLEKINLAFAGGTQAIEARRQAEDKAAADAKQRADEAQRAAEQAARDRAAVHQVRMQEAQEWLGALAKETAAEQSRANQAKKFFEEEKKRRAEAKAAEDAAAAARVSHLQQWAAVAEQSARAVGAALGAAAAGSTSSWRGAAIEMIQAMANMAAQTLLIWATSAAAMGHVLAAIRAVAAAVAIEGLAAAAVAYLQARESSRSQHDGSPAGSPYRSSGGPSIGVEGARMNVSLTQNFHGDISPASAQGWQSSAQEFLDTHMDRWMQRRRSQGYRFA